MNQQPITPAEYNALPDEKKELYGREVLEKRRKPANRLIHGFGIWTKANENELPNYDYYQYRSVHYPKPEALKQPTQQNAPLINEGGETVETHENDISVALLKKDDFRDEAFDIMSDSESGYYSAVDKAAAANQIADLYHAQATTLQTALAEANNKIAELERRLTPNNNE